jgi:Putative Actinobacterial Holin-X, holin superfamily III
VQRDEKSADGPRKLEAHDWPTLVARIFTDVARIVQTEIRLFQASLNPILSAAIDRLLGSTIAMAAFLAGGLCLLASAVVFLHRWFWWDASLAIAGVISFIGGYAAARVAARLANQSVDALQGSFRHETVSRERANSNSTSARMVDRT